MSSTDLRRDQGHMLFIASSADGMASLDKWFSEHRHSQS